MSLTTEFVEVKIDGNETYDGFDFKQRGGTEHTQNSNSNSSLHLVKNPKWI